jgi:hypothetical protein
VEGFLKAFRHEPLPDLLNGLDPAAESISDPVICPVRAVGIAFQQNMRPPHLHRRPLQAADHVS